MEKVEKIGDETFSVLEFYLGDYPRKSGTNGRLVLKIFDYFMKISVTKLL